jgi:DNA invertase Pin-like site-specific DNA recombinase
MAKRITEEQIDKMVDLWKDRWPTKAIAIELGVSYTSVYQQLKKRYLVG